MHHLQAMDPSSRSSSAFKSGNLHFLQLAPKSRKESPALRTIWLKQEAQNMNGCKTNMIERGTNRMNEHERERPQQLQIKINLQELFLRVK
jgi:hypothetical protein